MIEWARQSKGGLLILALAIGVLVVFLVIAGCSLDRMIKVDVPPGVQDALGVPGKIELRDADLTFTQWKDHVQVDTKRFAANIEDARWIYAFVSSAIDTGLGYAEGPLATVPGGAMLLSGLTGLAGLYMRQPGWNKELQDEKEGSFKAGSRRALATLATAGNGGTGNGTSENG